MHKACTFCRDQCVERSHAIRNVTLRVFLTAALFEVHPSNAGHRAIAKVFKAVIEKS